MRDQVEGCSRCGSMENSGGKKSNTSKSSKSGSADSAEGSGTKLARTGESGDECTSGTMRKRKTCPICLIQPSSINQCSINRGYEMGYIPIKTKLARANKRSSSSKNRHSTSSSLTTEDDANGSQDICLWHSLAGTLVHCKNYETVEDL